MAMISVDVKFVEELNNRLVNVSDNVSLGELKRTLLAEMGSVSPTGDSTDFNLYLAFPVGDLETLNEITSGTVLLFVSTDWQIRSLSIELQTSERCWTVSVQRPGSVLGRRDNHSNYMPDVDIADYLPDPKSISRRQLVFDYHNTEWYIHKHDDARVPVFVNRQPLQERSPQLLRPGDQIIVGASVERPVVTLLIQ